MIYPKENIVYTGVLQILHPKNLSKWFILGQELTENNLRK
jgi:hypothetical protein